MSNLFKLSALSFLLFFACTNNNNKLKINLQSQSECVTNILKSTPNNMDSIYFHYEAGILEIKHFNAGFNCCPDKILLDITYEDNNITVVENEKESLCDCLCLFEIEYSISNLDPGSYQLLINEPYLNNDDQIIELDLNLTQTISGGIAIERHDYPWGLE